MRAIRSDICLCYHGLKVAQSRIASGYRICGKLITRMICVSRLGNLGQLGNQLFQLSAAIGAASRNNVPAKFPAWRYAEFFRGPFDQTLDESEIREEYRELANHYVQIPNRQGLDLFGFFQSHKYFSDCTSLIRDRLSFREGLLPPQWNAYEADCSIHVRRGDYLDECHRFVPLTMQYYNDAIAYMKSAGCKSFLVFSDDPEWCKLNFPADMIIVEGLSDIQSLCLMSRCKNHIIANSTYSWWGSWLCTNPAKIVVAPQVWYGFDYSVQQNEDYQYCSEWKLIPNQLYLSRQILSLLKSKKKRLFFLHRINRSAWLDAEFEEHAKVHGK